MRARLLLTFTLLLGLGCTESTGPQQTERPAFRVEERFGRLVLINDWYRPIYAMVADVREGEDFNAQLCVVQECVEIPVGDSRVFDYEAILGGDPRGSVRVFVWGQITLASPDAEPRGTVVVREFQVGSPFAR
jgi:hypothetical protein